MPDLRSRIVAEIATSGPMRFDRYMELCLYDPESGFFGAGRGAPGHRSDFVTSAETSRWFGSLIAGWALDVVGRRSAAAIDVGAGSGHLAGELSEAWIDIGEVYAIERSGPARAALAGSLPSVTIGSDLDVVSTTGSAVVVGNEIMDNMPAALARATEHGWAEVAVDTDGDVLEFVDIESRPEVEAWCSDVFGEIAPGTLVTAQLALHDWIVDLMGRFTWLRCCLIDYAATSDVLATRRPNEIVRAYRSHRAVSSLLDDPGGTDLTVDVNIDGVARAVGSADASLETTDQRTFLAGLGALELIEDFRIDERDLASRGRIMEQLMVRSERIDLEAILDPAGFGGFTVFTIVSNGRS